MQALAVVDEHGTVGPRLVDDAARLYARIEKFASMKLVVNQAYDNIGLASTQLLGSVMDSMMRNTPEALRFIDKAKREGVPAAVAERDGPFRDYSRGAPANKPNPANVITVPSHRVSA